MLFAKNGRAVVIQGFGVMLLGLALSTGTSEGACCTGLTGAVPMTAMSPVAASTCCVTPPPYHANRIMWTPGYGISPVSNPLVVRTVGYGMTAYVAPTPVAPVAVAPPVTCTATAPVATTTFRPFLYRLFHPFTPLIPTTTYRVAFGLPVTPCVSPCATCPATACMSLVPACPMESCAPACDSCGGAGGLGTALPSCPSGTCAPATTETPLPAPSLSPIPANGGNGIPQTFKETPQPATQPDVRLMPTPDPKTESENPKSGEAKSSIETPRLIDPVAHTTARPIRPASYIVPVTHSTRLESPAKRSVDVSGWRASRD